MKKLIFLLLILTACKKSETKPSTPIVEQPQVINKYTIYLYNTRHEDPKEIFWFSVNGKKINGMQYPVQTGDVIRVYNDPYFYIDMHDEKILHEAAVYIFLDTREIKYFGGRKIVDETFTVQ